MDDKKKIDVCIADCAPIPILVSKDEDAIVDKAQENVTHLWKMWKGRYSKEKSPMEVMAMVAFQFARLYYSREALDIETNNLLSEFENTLDSYLNKTNKP